jgi:hypothetical protein
MRTIRLPKNLRLHIVRSNQNEGEMNSQNKINENTIRIKHRHSDDQICINVSQQLIKTTSRVNN